MQKEIKRVDEKQGIVQLTTLDERFYGRMESDERGIEEFVWRPSVTWICDFYPKGTGFQTWLKKNGDDADLIARLAADRGYKVHGAIAKLNAGQTVKMNDRFHNPTLGHDEELTVDEYSAVMSYVEWWNTEASKRFHILAYEYTVWPDAKELAKRTGFPEWVFDYAGTVDLKLEEIDTGLIWIVDMKTSLDVWPAHKLQVSAYAKADNADRAAILQLNYRRNKTKKWKFTPVADEFALFCSVQKIWKNETDGIEPLQRDFPLQVSLNLGKK